MRFKTAKRKNHKFPEKSDIKNPTLFNTISFCIKKCGVNCIIPYKTLD